MSRLKEKARVLGPLLPEDPRKDAKGLYARRDADPLPVAGYRGGDQERGPRAARPHGGP